MNKKILGLILIVVVVIGLALLSKSFGGDTTTVNNESDTSTWNAYVDPEGVFEFKYPPSLTIQDWKPKGLRRIDFQGLVGAGIIIDDGAPSIFSPGHKTKTAAFDFAGGTALRIFDCVDISLAPPCVLPETEAEVLTEGTWVRFDRGSTTYDIQVMRKEDIYLLEGILSTFHFY